MSIKVALEHRTTYSFDRSVTIGPHLIRLRPAPHCRTPVQSYSLSISPTEHLIHWQQDPFGNYLARVMFPAKADRLEIAVGLVADLSVLNPFDFFVEGYAEQSGFRYPTELAADLKPYLEQPAQGAAPTFSAWLDRLPSRTGDQPIVEFLVGLNTAVNRDVAYSVRMEPGVQTPEITLTRQIGSCRDSAWLLVSALRHHGLAARFVSGYLVQLAADAQRRSGGSDQGGDVTDLHAWAEVYIPGAGWIGLDPTSALFAGEGHIPLAATPNPASSAAITGVTEPCEVTMDFVNRVRRVHQDPRVSKPYTPQQMERLHDLGPQVDQRLTDAGVELTMSGEPTFAIAADGTAGSAGATADSSRERLGALAAALRRRYAPAGVVQQHRAGAESNEGRPDGQISVIWRRDGVPLWTDRDGVPLWTDRDGVPLWTDAKLLADLGATDVEGAGKDPAPNAVKQAEEVALALTEAFGLPKTQCRPAYEDVGPSVQSTPAAWVLPLTPPWWGESWTSPGWPPDATGVPLLLGTTPGALRLPLHPPKISHHFAGEASVFAVLDQQLPDPDSPYPTASVTEPDPMAARSAVVVEARSECVYVSLPQLAKAEHFVQLVRVLKRVVTDLATPVVLEGAGPPPDPRLATVELTPGPGAISVKLQPAGSWAELSELTMTVYAAAREHGFRTDTFGSDGRQLPTGGHHLTVGGVEGARSPMLRRPDLLVSMLAFWQHHPALSYLFSGPFVGPNGHAPRVDEGLPDTVSELELAFAEVERLGDADPRPWIVDRALRGVLGDVTGDPTRAEFAIAQLYSPDSLHDRLGAVKLRGFQTPPHPDMALVQALLVRALLARFAGDPYRGPLARWGATLHDRFLLPHYVEADAAEVVTDLRQHGIEFLLSWLDPFLEFRFPLIGITQVGEVELELRSAIEQWSGREATGGGRGHTGAPPTQLAAVERLQLKVSGAVPGRHLVTCNGVAVPLISTGTPGTSVAGVRYWARRTAAAPHLGPHVDTPLVFEVVDRPNRVCLGGATYHATHPGGGADDSPPLGANEAESRRIRRFEPIGRTAGEVDVEELVEQLSWHATTDTEHPLTLDLRRRPRRRGPR